MLPRLPTSPPPRLPPLPLQGRLLLTARSSCLRGLKIADADLNVTALLMEEVGLKAASAASAAASPARSNTAASCRRLPADSRRTCRSATAHSLALGTRTAAPTLPQVCAYVTQTDVDPDAPVLWLQPSPAGFQLPPAQGALPLRCGSLPTVNVAPCLCAMLLARAGLSLRTLRAPHKDRQGLPRFPPPCRRRIFEPIQLSLRHSKLSSSAGAGGAGAASLRRRSQLSSRGSVHRRSPSVVGGGGHGRGEELLLRVGGGLEGCRGPQCRCCTWRAQPFAPTNQPTNQPTNEQPLTNQLAALPAGARGAGGAGQPRV